MQGRSRQAGKQAGKHSIGLIILWVSVMMLKSPEMESLSMSGLSGVVKGLYVYNTKPSLSHVCAGLLKQMKGVR